MINEVGIKGTASNSVVNALTEEWFLAAFARLPGEVPADIRAATMAFCRVYQVRDEGAPAAIANTLATAIGRGDGFGRFEGSIALPTQGQLRQSALALARVYGSEIAQSRARQQVSDVLEMTMRAAVARSLVPVRPDLAASLS